LEYLDDQKEEDRVEENRVSMSAKEQKKRISRISEEKSYFSETRPPSSRRSPLS